MATLDGRHREHTHLTPADQVQMTNQPVPQVTHHNPHVKFPEHYQTLREYRTHGDLAEAEEAEETESPAGEAGSNTSPLHGSDEDSVGEHTPRSSTASTLMHMAGQPLSDYAGIIGPMTFDGFDSMAPLPSQETSIPSWPSASTIQMNGDLTQAAEEFGYEVAASRNLGSAAPQTSSYSPRPSGITKRSSRLRSVSQSPNREQVRRVGTVPVPPQLNRRVSRGSSMKVG